MAAGKQDRGSERRSATQETIAHLLSERQEMWVLYERLAGVDPYAGKPEPMALKEFIQILIDYISAAHFGLYERISGGTERRKGVDQLAQDLYPSIASTTEVAIAFNDKYAEQSPQEVSDELTRDLSKLGENLASRIEHEDQLIERLLSEERRKS